MEEWPFKGVPEKKAQKALMEGRRPKLYTDIYNSTEPVVVAIREAMYMCHEQDPVERATSRAVETYLKSQLEDLDPGRLDEWMKVTKKV